MKRVFMAAAALCWSTQALACDPDLIKAIERMAAALGNKEAQAKQERSVSGEDYVPRQMIVRSDTGERK